MLLKILDALEDNEKQGSISQEPDTDSNSGHHEQLENVSQSHHTNSSGHVDAVSNPQSDKEKRFEVFLRQLNHNETADNALHGEIMQLLELQEADQTHPKPSHRLPPPKRGKSAYGPVRRCTSTNRSEHESNMNDMGDDHVTASYRQRFGDKNHRPPDA